MMNDYLQDNIIDDESVNFRIDVELMMTDPNYQLAIIDFMYLDRESEGPNLPVS